MLKNQNHGGSENAHPSRPMQTAEPNRKLVLMLSKLNSHISQLCTSLLSG